MIVASFSSFGLGFTVRVKGAPMKCRHTALTTILRRLIGFSWVMSSWSAQQSSSATVPVSTVVSVEARHGKDVPALNREDVRVFEDHNRLQVTDWIPLQGDQSSLELFVLIDDASNTDLASQFAICVAL